ncbi:MAG: FecR domain-containing protein [Elusimicrobia bacterium]|nr:FecR domain-containing protein [Elusimicrobiota bacterium]
MKAMSCAVLLVSGAWAAGPAPQPAPPAAPTAALGPFFGSAQSQEGGSDAWFFVRPGRSLPPGSMVKTEAGSFCLILLSDGTKLRLGPRSYLRLVELSADRTEMSLASGRLEAWVKRRGKAEFKMQTPLFTAVLPEGSFATELLSANSAMFDVYKGDPEISDTEGRTQKMSPEMHVEFDAKTGASTPIPLPSGAARLPEPSEAGPTGPESIKEAVPAPAKPAAQALDDQL